MSAATAIVSKKRTDYKPSSHLISKVDIAFKLSPANTTVTNTMLVTRADTSAKTLFLDGEGLKLINIAINGTSLIENEGYIELDNGLQINTELDEFELCITNIINPEANTSLEGLYFSNQAFCTQCEAEGFRKITYFLDRPDILAVFTVSITTDNSAITYLLSNGNLIKDTGFSDGSRTCVWHDPHPKPCYLFALVAGHFDLLEDKFTTQSGREVALRLFVDEGRLSQGQHALDSLKLSMKWDEDTYGLEYDLDIYMVVAVDFFNMGAMENKGLNVFNSKFVLADPTTATDTDYFNIESIIAHEYFHNWTGNRVTCRDWFQLSLKEGLTVFRDQQFSADMFSYLKTRVDQVKVMQERQFAEDAGPMSHPIRPDEVVEMNNFYTVTVYDKGAEVIRMLHTLLGKIGFRKGMDLYFERHDGCAVTCDDFVNAMEDANNHDLTHFKAWYSQSGTPVVRVSQSIDKMGNTLLEFTQEHKATADQTEKKALFIPIKLECISETGEIIDSGADNDTFVLTETHSKLSLGKLSSKISPSLLQDFSAPVIVKYDYMPSELITIIKHASNDYAKWEAAQRLLISCFVRLYQELEDVKETDIGSSTESNIDNDLIVQDIKQYADALSHLQASNEVMSMLLVMPDIEACMAQVDAIHPLIAVKAHDSLAKILASSLNKLCLDLLEKCRNTEAYAYTKTQINQRALKASCMMMLAQCPNDFVHSFIADEYTNSDNMTDKLSALKAAQAMFEVNQNPLFENLMLAFEKSYSNDAVVMDKWFALHACTRRDDILSHLDLLQSHPQFSQKNPNKVRAVIGSFAFYNIAGFHQDNGLGYKYVCDYLMILDKINPQVASRIITPLIQISNLSVKNQDLIKAQLHRLFASKGLSKDLFEKISKSLG